MEILVIRKIFGKTSTISDVLINGKFQCYCLEDTDRGLKSSMSLEEIKALKVYAQTAIPEGRYELIISFSNRFQQYMPLLLAVPGFEGVRIHSGNTHADTEGCPLLGQTKADDFVGNSRLAYRAFFKIIKEVEKKEKIFIEFKRA